VPQESGAAGALWGFGHVGDADDVRARRVERCFFALGRVNKPVQMRALLIARDDCECSWLRIERMNASPVTARGEPAEPGLVVMFDPQ
jgi:hypothetical protein